VSEVPGSVVPEPNMLRLFDAACFLDRRSTHKPQDRYPPKLGHFRHSMKAVVRAHVHENAAADSDRRAH
jgi:hypothetical protein